MDQELTTDQEIALMKSILHMLEGNDAELCISALTRVLGTLLVGIGRERSESLLFATKLTLHLQKHLNTMNDQRFGFLRTQDGPILYKRKETSCDK